MGLLSGLVNSVGKLVQKEITKREIGEDGYERFAVNSNNLGGNIITDILPAEGLIPLNENKKYDINDNNITALQDEVDYLENRSNKELNDINNIAGNSSQLYVSTLITSHEDTKNNLDIAKQNLKNAKYNKVQSFRESSNLKNNFDIPNWGIKDFINERANWQKQLGTVLGEPAWFYFKIFFKFDTSYGLLGSILTNNGRFFAKNSASQYLYRIRDRYAQEKINDRLNALTSFVKTLSFISSQAPWMFISVKDVDKSLEYTLDKPKEQKTLTIECMKEAVDMRLDQLFDMYRYAAFDFAHDKEILPENLRKFDMDIVIFQSPLKYMQTSMKDLKGNTVNYKNLNDQKDVSNRMSFRLFSFQNCEFDINSFSSLIPSSMNNEKAFEFKPSFKIKYDKVYHHTLNEWTRTLVGDSGLLWSKFTSNVPDEHTDKIRRSMLQNAYDNQVYYNASASQYQYLVEASEDIITNAMRVVSPKVALGNLYRQYDPVEDMKEQGKYMWNQLADPYKNIDKSFKDKLGF